MSVIEWTDRTWNPVRGCSRVSPGCEHCYAERQAHRFNGKGQPYEGLTVLGKHGPRWAGRARFVPEMLGVPLRWHKPQRVFVNSMSDLFHEDVTDREIAAVVGVMALACHHTYQVLTKRPERMQRLMSALTLDDCVNATIDYPDDVTFGSASRAIDSVLPIGSPFAAGSSAPLWPLPNVWLGVSCEDQQRANERIPLLLQTPAAVRFVSAEPLLEPIDIKPFVAVAPRIVCTCAADGAPAGQRCNTKWVRCNAGLRRITWVIVGGESGPGARPCATEWIEQIVDECAAAGVPCFVKQLGAWPLVPHDEPPNRWPVTVRWQDGDYLAAGAPLRLRTEDHKGGDPTEWPEALRVREFPKLEPAFRSRERGR